ncbi:ammonium transporter [Aquimonas sp.]|jgi:Amt family ammonium transporter|uniref:ammonium transporter n=1 Tax=Aquimonas sp. TaxID=1872588 RepID=UPI0037C1000E
MRKRGSMGLAAAGWMLSEPAAAQAGVPASLDVVHLVWIAACCGMVLMMQPGFALLESGFARSKNAVNVLMKNFTDCAITSLGFWLVGFGLMFGTNPSGWFGTSSFMPNASSELVNVLFQTLFAATAATIISGAVAERIRYLPYLLGTLGVVVVIYPLFGSWAWGGSVEQPGWLRGLGFLDSAGGAAVHTVGGFVALAACIVLGPRFGRFGRDGSVREVPGHSLPLAALGAFLLWIGWFAFNGGAAEKDFSDLGRIVLNTHLAAAAGILGAIGLLLVRRKPILMSTVINGALGGLVSITAGAKYLGPASAVLVGLCAGLIVVAGGHLLRRLQIDDVVDAVPVHAFCGVFGTLMLGVLFEGAPLDAGRIGVQAIGAAVAAVWAFGMGYAVFKLIDVVIGLRAPVDHERSGLDYTEHHELAYPEFMTARTHRAIEPGGGA